MLINQIYKHISESIKNKLKNKLKSKAKYQLKKSLIDDLSKRLLELESKSNYSIKTKCLKWVVKNILPNYKKWKTHDQQ